MHQCPHSGKAVGGSTALHGDTTQGCQSTLVSAHGSGARHRPTTTVHNHCNSTPRTTSTTDPEKIEAQPNSFVKIVDGVHVEEEILEVIPLAQLRESKAHRTTRSLTALSREADAENRRGIREAHSMQKVYAELHSGANRWCDRGPIS